MTSEVKAKALADVAAAHVAFKEAVRGIPEERLSGPMHGEWSAKDLIAHISSWNEFTSLDMRRLARGHVPCMAAFREADVNEWNAFLVRPRKLFPVPQVIAELEGCYDALAEALATVPQAMFEGMVVNICSSRAHRDCPAHQGSAKACGGDEQDALQEMSQVRRAFGAVRGSQRSRWSRVVRRRWCAASGARRRLAPRGSRCWSAWPWERPVPRRDYADDDVWNAPSRVAGRLGSRVRS
jgi:hypothetical protein